jgi:hypothetical protein
MRFFLRGALASFGMMAMDGDCGGDIAIIHDNAELRRILRDRLDANATFEVNERFGLHQMNRRTVPQLGPHNELRRAGLRLHAT